MSPGNAAEKFYGPPRPEQSVAAKDSRVPSPAERTARREQHQRLQAVVQQESQLSQQQVDAIRARLGIGAKPDNRNDWWGAANDNAIKQPPRLDVRGYQPNRGLMANENPIPSIDARAAAVPAEIEPGRYQQNFHEMPADQLFQNIVAREKMGLPNDDLKQLLRERMQANAQSTNVAANQPAAVIAGPEPAPAAQQKPPSAISRFSTWMKGIFS